MAGSGGSEVLVDMPIDDDDDHSMSDDMSPQHTQIKLSQAQPQEVNAAEDVRSTRSTAPDQQRPRACTPEPKHRRSQKVEVQPSPSTPGRLAPFDWEDFEGRYQRALADADQNENELLDEFEQLVKVRLRGSSDAGCMCSLLTTTAVFQCLGRHVVDPRQRESSQKVRCFSLGCSCCVLF
jgi:hypothetical protein